jgi:hypothetical protein
MVSWWAAPALPFSQSLKGSLGFRRELVKAQEVFTRLFRANDTVFQAPVEATLPDLANPAIADLPSAHGQTTVAVNIFLPQLKTKLLGIQGHGLFPGVVIIVLGGQESGAIRTDQPAISNHFSHGPLIFSVLSIQNGGQDAPDVLSQPSKCPRAKFFSPKTGN